MDSQDRLYIVDGHRIRAADARGIITTFAGTGTAGFSGDGGPATAARLSRPAAVAVDSQGNVFISDDGNEVLSTSVGPQSMT